MRLWHVDLIPYLPKSQLLAQWRELNSIFKKQDKHILINYVYDYSKFYLLNYTNQVLAEMWLRDYKIKSFDNYNKYFEKEVKWFRFPKYSTDNKFFEHNNEYLTICYWNLREKYLRGQKDFTDEVWEKLDNFYKSVIK